MTQGLDNLLNLPSMEEILKEKGVLPKVENEINPDEFVSEEETDNELLRTVEMAQQAQKRLDMVEGTDHSEAMDKLHAETLKHAQDLMDLGFNIDLPRARGIFEVAANMYGRAIEAKNAKRDAQLKAMKLALDQRKLDLEEKKLKLDYPESEQNKTIIGNGTIIKEDRNELIKRLRAERENKKNLPE